MKLLKLICHVTLFTTLSSAATIVDYTGHDETKKFIDLMVKEDKFCPDELNALFANVELQHRSLKFYKTVKKKKKKKKKSYGSWSRYEKKLLNTKRVDKGIAFMLEHQKTLERAYKEYGIPAEYITAIIGIESYYGAYTGKHPVFDTLCTLAFEENRRNEFFTKELREFLKMTKREALNPRELKGSYAGAIGLGQFMPSNFEKLGVDFNNDGKVRISEPEDAIGSIANYFKQSGWKKGVPVATRVSYKGERFNKLKTGYLHKYSRNSLKDIFPKDKSFTYNDKVSLIKLERVKYDELWYGTKNFYVITRYNHSSYYAMAVHQLAQKIKEGYNKRHLAMK